MDLMKNSGEFHTRTITQIAVTMSWHWRDTDKPYYPVYLDSDGRAVSPPLWPHCKMFATEAECSNYIAMNAKAMFEQARVVGLRVK